MADQRVAILFPPDGGYQLQYGEEISEEFDFGEVAELKLKNGKILLAFLDVDKTGKNIESDTEHLVYLAEPIKSYFPEEDENEDEDEEDGEGDGDENEGDGDGDQQAE